MRARVHLFTDADNTLWDTDAVYARAQVQMLREVEVLLGVRGPNADRQALQFLRRLDQQIAAEHPDDLRYPPLLLAAGLQHTLRGEDPATAVRLILSNRIEKSKVYQPIVDRFLTRLRRRPRLRIGVRRALTVAAAHSIPVTIVTESSTQRSNETLESCGLRQFVSDIISARKTPALYEQLKQSALADRLVMVGDQYDRDILPARAAGFDAFLYPGRFRPYWNERTVCDNRCTIKRFDEILKYIDAQNGHRTAECSAPLKARS